MPSAAACLRASSAFFLDSWQIRSHLSSAERPVGWSVLPMLATKVGAPFSREGWIFKPKWDGYRALCFLRDGVVRFTSRNQRDLTRRFPELQIIAKSIKASSAIIDGEIVAIDGNGAQCFEQLQNHKRDCAIIYFAFDLIFLDGESLIKVPLIQRKAHLKRILPKSMAGRLRFTDHVIDRGLDLFAALETQCLEGMVAKRADSLYVPGRSKDWLKVKTRAGREQMNKRIETWGHR
jgi:bifunctional non-homologous end joining protein LigD